mgnify:CR=1 FL=1
MSEHSAQHDSDKQRELRDQERQRFIRQYRLKPAFWLATAGASLRYLMAMAIITLMVIPPAAFYWTSLIAARYDITAITEILAHVGLGAFATAGAATAGETMTATIPSIDTIGLAIWALIGSIFVVAGWFLTPFKSPLQKAADKHMMEWTGPAAKQDSILSPAIESKTPDSSKQTDEAAAINVTDKTIRPVTSPVTDALPPETTH